MTMLLYVIVNMGLLYYKKIIDAIKTGINIDIKKAPEINKYLGGFFI